jgi:hypothetical protein
LERRIYFRLTIKFNHGFFKRLIWLSKGKKEVLVNSYDINFSIARYPYRYWWRIFFGSLYLHIILIVVKNNPYQTILVIVIGFLLLGYVFPSTGKYFYFLALIVGILSLISPVIGDSIIWGWEKFSHALGWFNSKVLLSIVFFLFLTPIAFLYRIFRKKDTLMLKRPPDNSAFVERNHTFTSRDLENPW